MSEISFFCNLLSKTFCNIMNLWRINFIPWYFDRGCMYPFPLYNMGTLPPASQPLRMPFKSLHSAVTFVFPGISQTLGISTNNFVLSFFFFLLKTTTTSFSVNSLDLSSCSFYPFCLCSIVSLIYQLVHYALHLELIPFIFHFPIPSFIHHCSHYSLVLGCLISFSAILKVICSFS